MAFSLSNLLRQGTAQLNPFDNGQTAATVRAQQKPPAAQLPSPGQPVARSSFVSRLGQAPHPVQINTPDVISSLQHPKFVQHSIAATPNGSQQVINNLNAMQSQTHPSLAQGLNNAGAALDQATMKNLVQPFISRPAMEIAQSIRQQVTHKASTYTPGSPTAQAFFGNSPIDSIQKKVGDQYKRQSTSSNPVLRVASRPLAAGEAVLSVANDLPVVGGLAKGGTKLIDRVAPKALPATKLLAKDVGTGIKAAQARVGTNDAITAQQKQLASEIQGHQNQIDKLPINNHTAAEVLQRKIDVKQGQIANLEATRPQQNIIQKASDRVIGSQPGMGIRPVNPTAVVTPEVPKSSVVEPAVSSNSLTKGAQAGRQSISAETQALIQGEHNVRNTQQLADASAATVDKLPTNTAIEQAHNALARPLGHVTDEQTGFIAKTIEKADAAATEARQAGDTVEADRLSREAAALHDGLSEHAVARGQANQALTMLYNRSPQGLYHSAIRDLGKAGVEIKPELQAKLQGLADAIKTAPDQATKADALGTFHKAVSDTMPQNLSDKAIGIWKAGLLSGVKTQQGNAISNATFGTLKKISDVPASVVDKGLSLITGKQTIGLTGKGVIEGTKEGTTNAKYTLKSGIDRRSAGDKYEQHAEINFKNPILNKTVGSATRGIFRGMNAADQPFWYAAFKNSMYDQAKAAGVTKGLRGSELTKFMDETVKNPGDAMANTALKEANKSTLNYDTLGSKAVQGMHTAIDKFPGATKQGKAVAHGVINVLAPFVRVPTAFLSRTVDFTPMGVGKEIFHQVASGKFDQRAISQAVGEGLTGTGAIALGVALTQHNMLSGDYPKNDQKEIQRWKAEGITPNSVKLGNKWVSLNYLGPLGLLFNAGNKIENAKGQGAVNQAGQAVAGFGQGLMGQSFLQGFSGFSNAIQDPQRNLKSFINSQAGSIVPSIVNDAANATDSMQRQANNPGQSIQSRIPGAREGLPVKQDVYGNPLQQPAGPIGTLIGVKPSNNLTTNNPVTSEVNRLHSVDPNNGDLQITPTPITSVTIPGANKGDKSTVIKLNDKQKYDLQKQVGQTIQSDWGKIIDAPGYQAMSDTEKAKKLTSARQDATELATRQYVTDNNLGSYTKPASKGAQGLAQGNIDKYTNGSLSGTTISSKIDSHSQKVLKEYAGLSADQIKQKAYAEPSYDYKVAYAKYQNDMANGKLSKAQQISRSQAVAKAKTGSDFSKDVRELYNLSSTELGDYLTTDNNGQAMYDQLKQYDQALLNKGIIKTSKFKYGLKTTASSAGSKVSKANANAYNQYSGNGNALKYEKTLRGLVDKASMGRGKASTKSLAIKAPKLKTYKVAKQTSLKPRKAFA